MFNCCCRSRNNVAPVHLLLLASRANNRASKLTSAATGPWRNDAVHAAEFLLDDDGDDDDDDEELGASRDTPRDRPGVAAFPRCAISLQQ